MPRGVVATKEEYAQVLDYLEQYPDASRAEIAEGIDESQNTVRNWVRKLGEIGAWDADTQTVNRQKFEEWTPERKRRRLAPKKTQKPPPEDTLRNIQVIRDVVPEGSTVVPEVIREVIRKILPDEIPFNNEEIRILGEVIEWWKKEGRNTQVVRKVVPDVIPQGNTVLPEGSTSKTRRSFWIEDDLYEILKKEATRQGLSMADLVNEAIRAYLGENERGGDDG